MNITFNYDYAVMIKTELNKFNVYTINNAIQKIFDVNYDHIIEMTNLLKKTNIFCYVKKDNDYRNIVVLWDNAEKKELLNINFPDKINNIKLIDNHIIIVSEYNIYMFDFEGKHIYSKNTYYNPNGLLSIYLSPDENNDLIISTLGINKGDISLWKPFINKCDNICAHLGNILTIKMSGSGKYIATSSDNGTNIHVFDTKNFNKVFELRRGTNILKNTYIYDTAFRQDDGFLACVSTNGTIHIFDLNINNSESTNLKSSLYFMSSYLPKFFQSSWSCKKHDINISGQVFCVFNDKILYIITKDDIYFKIFGDNYNLLETNID